MQEIKTPKQKQIQKFFNKHYTQYLKNLHNYLRKTTTSFMRPIKPTQTMLVKISNKFTNSTINFNTNLGKGIRPYFAYITLYATLKFLSQNTLKQTINFSQLYDSQLANIVGSYLELIHNHLLIHDDFMDKSIKRRGQDTVWYSLFKQIQNKHMANSLAVLSGNSTLLTAINKLLEIKSIPASNVSKALKLSTHIINKVIYGQVLDIAIEKVPIHKLELEDILAIYKNKTAIYTNVFPVKLIVELFGMSQHWQNTKNLYTLLLNLGIIFQILDDLKDLTQSGKTQFLDIIDRKRTILVFYTAQNITSPKRRTSFINFYNKKRRMSPSTVANIITEFGIPTAQNFIKQLWEDSLNIYNSFPDTAPEKFITEHQMFLIAHYYNKITKNLKLS